MSTPRTPWRLVAPCIVLAACSDGASPPARDAADVRIASPSVALGLGETATLEASVLDAAGGALADRRVTWRALDAGKLEVDAASGRVVAQDTGTARVEARAETRRGVIADTATIVVERRVASLVIELPADSLLIGSDTLQARAVARDGKGEVMAEAPVQWSVDESGVALVGADGRITGRAEGTATLTAGAGAVTASKSVRARYRRLALGFVPQSIGVGDRHGCALDASGQAHCWGNSLGALGRGSTTSGGIAPVSTTERFTQLVADNESSCGITAEGRLFCWGRRSGRSDSDPGLPRGYSSVPYAVIDSVPMREMHIGTEGAMCALARDGRPWCWGRLDAYQGGDYPSTEDGARYDTPVPTPTDLRFATMHTGFHSSCGLEVAGTAWCWGDVVGGMRDTRRNPSRIEGAPAFTHVREFDTPGMACGVTASGEMWCWGSPRDASVGQLVARRIPGVPPIRTLSTALSGDLCALAQDGSALCWPDYPTTGAAPTRWGAPFRFRQIVRSRLRGAMCGITVEGEVLCTGSPPLP